MYAMGLHQEALLNLEEAGLDNLTLHSVSSRMLRIIAEAYAVKGIRSHLRVVLFLLF